MNRKERRARHKEIEQRRKEVNAKKAMSEREAKQSLSEAVPAKVTPKMYGTISDAVRSMSKRALEQEVENWRKTDLTSVVMNMQNEIARLRTEIERVTAQRDLLMLEVEKSEMVKGLNKIQAWKAQTILNGVNNEYR